MRITTSSLQDSLFTTPSG